MTERITPIPSTRSAGSDAAEWHRYLHAEGILVPDEGEECGPWHHRVFMDGIRSAGSEGAEAPDLLERLRDIVMGEPYWPRVGAVRRRAIMDKIEAALHAAPPSAPDPEPEGTFRFYSIRLTPSEIREAVAALGPTGTRAEARVKAAANAMADAIEDHGAAPDPEGLPSVALDPDAIWNATMEHDDLHNRTDHEGSCGSWIAAEYARRLSPVEPTDKGEPE